jgi:hypothetical protein
MVLSFLKIIFFASYKSLLLYSNNIFLFSFLLAQGNPFRRVSWVAPGRGPASGGEQHSAAEDRAGADCGGAGSAHGGGGAGILCGATAAHAGAQCVYRIQPYKYPTVLVQRSIQA